MTIEYKILSKVFSNRMCKVHRETILHSQSAFVEDCQILDAILVVNELVDDVKWKGCKGVVFKLD